MDRRSLLRTRTTKAAFSRVPLWATIGFRRNVGSRDVQEPFRWATRIRVKRSVMGSRTRSIVRPSRIEIIAWQTEGTGGGGRRNGGFHYAWKSHGTAGMLPYRVLPRASCLTEKPPIILHFGLMADIMIRYINWVRAFVACSMRNWQIRNRKNFPLFCNTVVQSSAPPMLPFPYCLMRNPFSHSTKAHLIIFRSTSLLLIEMYAEANGY